MGGGLSKRLSLGIPLRWSFESSCNGRSTQALAINEVKPKMLNHSKTQSFKCSNAQNERRFIMGKIRKRVCLCVLAGSFGVTNVSANDGATEPEYVSVSGAIEGDNQ